MGSSEQGFGGFAGFISAVRGDPEDRPSALERALAAPDKPDPEPADGDEVAAALLAKSYAPGMGTDLARRYADKQAELQGVREGNEKARKTQARIARDHQAGRISAFDIAAMDFGEPDLAREQQLERQCESLRRQMQDTQALIAPAAQRDPDPLEAASRRAHQAFVETTRSMLAGQPRPQAPRPFESGAVAAGEPDCETCPEHLRRGKQRPATAAQMAQIHRSVCEQGRPDAYPPGAVITTGHREAYDAEVERLTAAGYSLATAQYAATPAAYR